MAIPFLKMHGLGNDFVVIDDLGKPKALCQRIDAWAAREICDRRFGVGADQLLWLKAPQESSLDARMEIFNADGSVAEMCGNGIRAVAVYLFRHGPKRKERYTIETLAGTKTVRVQEEMGMPLVSVDMGAPKLMAGFPSEGEVIHVGGVEHRFFEVSMGNPHAVVFVDRAGAGGGLDGLPVEQLGPGIEHHPRFPERTNVEFVEVAGPGSIRVRVWERGAGITLACGTGACAAAVAAIATGRVRSPVEVELPGGKLRILWGPGEKVVMEGPAVESFRGEYFQRERG